MTINRKIILMRFAQFAAFRKEVINVKNLVLRRRPLQHIMRFEGKFEIMIMNTGNVVHNRKEYVHELLEAEALQAEFVKDSGNYFVIVNRAPLRM